jgi:hypothetical protein
LWYFHTYIYCALMVSSNLLPFPPFPLAPSQASNLFLFDFSRFSFRHCIWERTSILAFLVWLIFLNMISPHTLQFFCKAHFRLEVARAVEHLLCKHETLIPVPQKKKRFHSFLWLNNSICIYTILPLFIHLLRHPGWFHILALSYYEWYPINMDICISSAWWLHLEVHTGMG